METTGMKRLPELFSDNSEQVILDLGDTRPAKCKRAEAQAASQRHIKTEQARRDKISAGFQVLQELLPGREKVEKAMLLTQAADYINQLQDVLHLLMTSGAVSKLPDELQWQIRTLLPRKDSKAGANATPALTSFTAAPPTAIQFPSVASLSANLQMPYLPLIPQATLQMPDMSKDIPQDESALMAQVQNLLQQQQQQAAAAQQIQNWQQTLQTLQFQQVLQQQGAAIPELIPGSGSFSAAPIALASLPQMVGGCQQSANLSLPADINACKLSAPVAKRLGCFADDLPKCGLQQLVDAAACEQPSATVYRSGAAPLLKARKNAKVRRHTTAAKIPKPDDPTPARPGPGRPELV